MEYINNAMAHEMKTPAAVDQKQCGMSFEDGIHHPEKAGQNTLA